MNCPKCKAKSGDDWTQCNSVCPVQGSPHYNELYWQYEGAFDTWYRNMLDLSLNWGMHEKNPFRTSTQRQVIRNKQTKAELKRSWMNEILKFEEPELHKLVFGDKVEE